MSGFDMERDKALFEAEVNRWYTAFAKVSGSEARTFEGRMAIYNDFHREFYDLTAPAAEPAESGETLYRAFWHASWALRRTTPIRQWEQLAEDDRVIWIRTAANLAASPFSDPISAYLASSEAQEALATILRSAPWVVGDALGVTPSPAADRAAAILRAMREKRG